MKLIFVYNAKSGISHHLMDALHKTFSPKTYACDLCSLTYGNVGPKKEWKKFIDEIGMDTEFHYKDQFSLDNPGLKDNFPVIYLKEEGFQTLVTSDEMHQCKDLSQLIDVIKQRINTSK